MPDTATVPTWTLGDRLRKAREFAGLEQGELADRIGVSRGTISNYELGHGVRAPKPVVLRAWSAATGVPLDWMLEGDTRSATSRGSGRTTGRYRPLADLVA